MSESVDAVIARVPGWAQAADLHVEELAGLTNTNFLVTYDGERFVLRVSSGNTAHLGIDRGLEYQVLQAASQAGIGAEVVHFIEPEGHLVTRWIDGRHWRSEEYRQPENISRMVDIVKRLHALAPVDAAFSPFRRVEAFAHSARLAGFSFPEGFQGCLHTAQLVEYDQHRDPDYQPRLCHNDLVSVNFLVSPDDHTITLIDWEFAGMGDAYYDLATLVYVHDNLGPIPPELEEYLLECYFGPVNDHHRLRLVGMKFMLMFFTAMWGMSQYAAQKSGLIPSVKGFDYLKFSQYLFENDLEQCRQDYLSAR